MAFFLLELIPELIETGVELAEVADVEPFLGQGLDEIPGWIESAEEYLGDVPDLSYRAGDVAVSEEASFAEQSLATGMTVGLGIAGYASSTSSGGGSTLGSPEIAYPGSPRSNVPSTGPIGFPKTKMSFVGLKSVRGRKTIDHPHVKKVKVSHKLKEKIQKVIDQKYCHGAITNYYGGGWMEVTSDNQQSVYGGAGDRLCESNEGWCFTVTQYLKALNGLFAGVKPCNSAASLSPYAPKDGSGVTLGGTPFPYQNVQFKVHNSWVHYRFKNITPHPVFVLMFVCAPKKKGSWIEGNGSLVYTNNSSTVADLETFPSANSAWINACSEDVTQGWYIQGINGSQPYGTPIPSTPVNPSVTDLFNTPTSSKTFMNTYGVETVTLYLLPGQVMEHRIQGPKDLEIDTSKMFYGQTSVFQNIQKFSRSVICAVYTDLNASVLGVPPAGTGFSTGRFADKTDTPTHSGFTICTERIEHYSILCPEQAGGTFGSSTASGVVYDLDRRRPVHQKNYYQVNNSGSTIDVSTANPVQPMGDVTTDP